ncbi:hypothetical protein PQX77_021876 [Marasmius sp. AFHP31]|nr:hypothetical protein PQX77_021876 [Marasmius sp. AFHP31]
MSNHFNNAQGWTIGAHANFQTVAGNSTTNIYNNPNLEREDRMTLHGRTIRKVIDGDIHFQRVLSSEVLSVCKVKPEGASTSTESQVVKVKKMEQTAKIQGYRGKFTATSFEPVDKKDREQFKEIVNVVLEAAMCGRSALLKQVFAVAESENAMTMIAHDELANGFTFFNQYSRGKQQIVFYYLNYTLVDAIQALRDDETLRFPVTTRYRDWSFNVRNLTWQYNPASLCLDPPEESNLRPFFYPPPPLCQETPRRLNNTEIAAHVEKSLGDVLLLITGMGGTWDANLSYYARHGLLTLGTVINLNKPKILAHLPSSLSPEWFCWSRSPDVKAKYSSSGRVDLSFRKTGNFKVEFEFGWRVSGKDWNQLRCAFLCQSLRFVDDCDDVKRVIYIDQVGFSLQGTFPNDPTSHLTPTYLFVHPLPIDFTNNLHCIRYPLPEKLFYWSHDPQGRNAIAEEDWERFGVPELSMERWIGTYWKEEDYAFVREYLCLRSYDLDGKEYAHDHGHPELVFADPHDTARIGECEFSNSGLEASPSPSLASSSNSSLLEAPTNSTTGQDKGALTLDTHGLAATTHIANKRQRNGVGGAIKPRRIHAEPQDSGYDVSYGHRQSGFPPYNPSDFSSMHVSIGIDGANESTSGSFPHSMNTETPGIHPQYLTMADSFNPTTALQQNFTNRNCIPLTATNNFPSSPSLSNHVLFRNMRAISRPIDCPAEFAMHDRDALFVSYPGVGQDVTTAPPFFHAGNMQSTGMEPQHETTVDSTLSQQNRS